MLQVGWYGVHLPAQIFVQHGALVQTRFLIGGQSILFPEPCRWVVLVLVGPIASHLLVVFVKVAGLAVLGESPGAGKPDQRNC